MVQRKIRSLRSLRSFLHSSYKEYIVDYDVFFILRPKTSIVIQSLWSLYEDFGLNMNTLVSGTKTLHSTKLHFVAYEKTSYDVLINYDVKKIRLGLYDISDFLTFNCVFEKSCF